MQFSIVPGLRTGIIHNNESWHCVSLPLVHEHTVVYYIYMSIAVCNYHTDQCKIYEFKFYTQ